MSVKPIVGSALKVPLFLGLESEQISELVRRAERVVYEPGEALIQNGEIGSAAILVISGHATQFNPFTSMHPHDPIGPGSLVGEMAMLIETTHHLAVIADEPIKALKFHRPMIEAFMAEDPRLADHFVSRIASRLNDMAAEMRAMMASTSGSELLVDHEAGTNDQAAMAAEHRPTTKQTSRVEPSAFPVN